MKKKMVIKTPKALFFSSLIQQIIGVNEQNFMLELDYWQWMDVI